MISDFKSQWQTPQKQPMTINTLRRCGLLGFLAICNALSTSAQVPSQSENGLVRQAKLGQRRVRSEAETSDVGVDLRPEPGEYTLRLEFVGKNDESSGHSIGVNSIRLRERRPRVKAFGYDKDKDWRQKQVLYD